MKYLSAISAIILLFAFTGCGPDLSVYEGLTTPVIKTVPDSKMLVVEAKGDPNVAGKKAFGLLYKTFYKIKREYKASGKIAPRARWSGDFAGKKDGWTGLYALPLPQEAKEKELEIGSLDLKASITTWQYGEVAEILHKGGYAEETSNIEKLHKFIADSGYEIAGLHEEEYLKGPGMFFKGNPQNYYTIIRYQVRKKGGTN